MRQQIQQSQSCGPNLKSKTQVSIPKTVKTKDLDHEGEKKQKVRGLGWWETHMRRTEWECSKERLASRVRLVAGRVTFLMVLWGRVRVRRWVQLLKEIETWELGNEKDFWEWGGKVSAFPWFIGQEEISVSLFSPGPLEFQIFESRPLGHIGMHVFHGKSSLISPSSMEENTFGKFWNYAKICW